MDELQQEIALAKETLTATKLGTGSGTIACRLWWALRKLVDAIETASPPAERDGT